VLLTRSSGRPPPHHRELGNALPAPHGAPGDGREQGRHQGGNDATASGRLDTSTLTEEGCLAVEQVCRLRLHILKAHILFQQFVQIVRNLSGVELETRMHAAFRSGIPELRAF